MASSLMKSTFALLAALMVALIVAPSMAFAATWEGTHDTEKDDIAWTDAATDEQKNQVVLTVYAQYADDEVEVKQEFTIADLLKLASENTEVLGYAYQNAVYATDSYVTFDQIVKSIKKFSVNDEDSVVFSDASGPYGKGVFTNEAFIAGDAKTPGFKTVGQFFPGVQKDGDNWDFSSLGTAQDAPAVIALSYAEGKWADNDKTPAGAIWNDLSPYYSGSLRLFSGTTEAHLTGESAALPAGKISPSGIIGITVKTPASDKFVVYSQEGADATPVVAKEYDKASLTALADQSTKGFLFFKNVWTVGVTTKSVEVTKLLNDAGLTFESGDTIVFAAPDGFKTTFDYDTVQAEKYFFPSAVGTTNDASDPTEVGTVLALNWLTAEASGTAGSTMAELAEGALIDQYRVFCGVSEDNYGKQAAAGNRFATNPKTLTLIKAKAADPEPEPEPAAEPKAQTITASNVTKTFGAKPFNLNAKTNGDGKLIYKSSKAKVATVDASGKVTIKGAGTATITVRASATSAYKAAVKVVTVTVKKAANTLKLAKATRSLKAEQLEKAKKVVAGAKVSTAAKGAVTYKIAKVSKAKAKANFSINKKNGKITVKKGTAKGTYRVTVSATAKGNSNYKAATKKAVVTIKVK